MWIILNAEAGTARGKDETPTELRKAGRAAYGALKRQDNGLLLSMFSHERPLRMAVRRAIWTDQETRGVKRSPNENYVYLFDDLSRNGWEEREMLFDMESPPAVAKLKVALNRFAREVDNTYGSIEIAIRQTDAWNLRELGPSASGKMASNSFWYLYFRKEGPGWKIWKLELAIH